MRRQFLGQLKLDRRRDGFNGVAQRPKPPAGGADSTEERSAWPLGTQETNAYNRFQCRHRVVAHAFLAALPNDY